MHARAGSGGLPAGTGPWALPLTPVCSLARISYVGISFGLFLGSLDSVHLLDLILSLLWVKLEMSNPNSNIYVLVKDH